MDQFSSFFQSGGILDVTFVSTEIEVLFAGWAFTGTAHVMRFDFVFSEESVAGGTFA